LDFDCDGREDIYLTSDRYAALLELADGGTISALDCRTSNTALINSLMRRPEAYHESLRDGAAKGAHAPQSIHDRKPMKEEGLERLLHYDRWPRNLFRLFLFGRGKSYEDLATVNLEPDASIAGGNYRLMEVSHERVKMACNESRDWPVEKEIWFERTNTGFDVHCEISVRREAHGTASVNVGIESVLNFLAPSAPDRYFLSSGQRFPLRWSAAVPGPDLAVVDEWQKVRVALEAPGPRDFWIAPIETVSEAEDGFERVYQGSQIIAVWPVELSQDAEWKGKLTLRVEKLF
jgi:alpha-amylase